MLCRFTGLIKPLTSSTGYSELINRGGQTHTYLCTMVHVWCPYNKMSIYGRTHWVYMILAKFALMICKIERIATQTQTSNALSMSIGLTTSLTPLAACRPPLVFLAIERPVWDSSTMSPCKHMDKNDTIRSQKECAIKAGCVLHEGKEYDTEEE